MHYPYIDLKEKEWKLALCLQSPEKKFWFSLPVETDALIYLLHFLEMDRSKQAAAGVQHSQTKVVSFPGHTGSQAQRLRGSCTDFTSEGNQPQPKITQPPLQDENETTCIHVLSRTYRPPPSTQNPEPSTQHLPHSPIPSLWFEASQLFCIPCDGVSRHSWDSKIPLRSAAWESTKIWFLMSKINIMLVHVPESADCVPGRGLRENLTLREQKQSKRITKNRKNKNKNVASNVANHAWKQTHTEKCVFVRRCEFYAIAHYWCVTIMIWFISADECNTIWLI